MESRVKIGLIIVIIIGSVLSSVIISGVFTEKKDDNFQNTAVVSFELSDSTFLNFTCQVAETRQERSKGLMNREQLPISEGMLFVYDPPGNPSFWMKNTKIPLDIIFIHENSTVISYEEAEVELEVSDDDLTRYTTTPPVKWVVEINQGLCASNGIGPGTMVKIEYLN